MKTIIHLSLIYSAGFHYCQRPRPGRSIRDQDMREFRFLSRRYRNRRVGEFLKELEMTEGRGTGIPKILLEIQKNGSPDPIFHTDDHSTFFLVESPIHPVFRRDLKKKDTPQVTPQVTPEVGKMLAVITGKMTRGEIQEKAQSGAGSRQS